MAPKGPYKVYSLSKHIEDTQKGLSADAQYNKRPGVKPANSTKKQLGSIDKSIFGNNVGDEEDSDASSSSSSDGGGSSDEGGSDFLRKLAPQSAKASNATSKKRSKDEEIADSDDERKAAANKAASGSKSQPVTHGDSSEDASSSQSESESESEESEGKVRANGVPFKSPATSGNTSTSTSAPDSEDEDGQNESNSGEDEAPEKNTTRPEAKKESSESDSDEDDASNPKPAAASKTVYKSVNGTAINNSSHTSSSEEDSDGEEENVAPVKSNKTAEQSSSAQSDGSVSEIPDDGDADESMHITDRNQGSQVVAPPNFIAPDFVLRKSDDGAHGQDVAQVCNEANLQGKQVWYFTVPANVPISVVQNMEIPMAQSNRADRVFSHDGEDYGISFDSMVPKSSIQILIPSADGARYQSGEYHCAKQRHFM